MKENLQDRPYVKARVERYRNRPILFEVELHLLNDKPINENENAAWEIIKGAYHNILFNDPHWHFFYEDKYNLIRCSEEFYNDLIEYLEECGVTYIEKNEWEDSSNTVEHYKIIFTELFHQFSMMAIEEYNSNEIVNIFDRVAHCFLNHQYLVLKNYRKHLPAPGLWEPKLLIENGMYRSNYIGYCVGVEEMRGIYNEKLKDIVEYYESKDEEEEIHV